MPKTPKKRKRVYKFSLWQDGLRVASAESTSKWKAEQEIMIYALSYSAYGKVIVKDETKIRRVKA